MEEIAQYKVDISQKIIKSTLLSSAPTSTSPASSASSLALKTHCSPSACQLLNSLSRVDNIIDLACVRSVIRYLGSLVRWGSSNLGENRHGFCSFRVGVGLVCVELNENGS